MGANADWSSGLLVAADLADFPGKARVGHWVHDPSKAFQELNKFWRLIAQLLLGRLRAYDKCMIWYSVHLETTITTSCAHMYMYVITIDM